MHPHIHATKTPDKPAIIFARTGETITFRDLEARSNQVAQYFRSIGLKRGDAIAIFLENNPRYFDICWGAQRSGLYYTCISSRLSAGEIDYIVGDSQAKLFITSMDRAEIAKDLVDLMPNTPHRLMIDGTIPGFDSFEEKVLSQPDSRISDESTGMDMLYSSGTTGKPKGVRHQLPEEPIDDTPGLVTLITLLYGFDESSVYLSPAPLYHAAPLRYNMCVQRIGGTTVIMDHFDPEEALQNIDKYKITCSQWVPTMFIRILKMEESIRTKYDLSSHKSAIHAAAPCPIPVKKQMIEWWGPIINEYYAGTEGNGFCSLNSEEWLAHEGSVGKALLGELHIVGEDGEEVSTGETGTVYFANGAEFEYHNDPEKTKESRDNRGWSTLGDVGYVDDEGYLYLTDRKAFMIISGGVNIYPQESENLLVTHPKVADVAVIGVPNEDFGEEVKAVVQPVNWADAGPDLEAELIDFCLADLSKIKCPRSVDFMEELPRHPTGKLYKRLIRDKYWGKTDSRIV